DNPVNQTLALHILKKLGYNATLVENGLQALEAVDRLDYDIIFMDIQMPDLDGLAATQRIRKIKKKQPIIIAMTANAMQGDREKCLDAGMNDYLSKPVRLEDVVKVLDKWLSQISRKQS